MVSVRKTKIKAVGLLSGGLDSTLAAKLMLEQRIELYAVNFISPFCTCTPKKAGCAAAITAVKKLGGITLKRASLGDEYLRMVRNPKHGYGSGMNPCIDCRIIKIQKATCQIEMKCTILPSHVIELMFFSFHPSVPIDVKNI